MFAFLKKLFGKSQPALVPATAAPSSLYQEPVAVTPRASVSPPRPRVPASRDRSETPPAKVAQPAPLSFSKETVDLPLKALAWQDEQGQVWLSYNSPEHLHERHGFPAELMKNIAGIAALVQKAVE